MPSATENLAGVRQHGGRLRVVRDVEDHRPGARTAGLGLRGDRGQRGAVDRDRHGTRLGGGEMSRGEIDGHTEFVKIYGAKGLAYIKVNDAGKGREGLQSPILKFLSDGAIAGLISTLQSASATVSNRAAESAKEIERQAQRLDAASEAAAAPHDVELDLVGCET